MRARDNPFRTECLQRLRYRFAGITWEELLGRCERLNYRGAVVGRCGSGKTTLLEELAPKLQERGLVTRSIRLSREQPSFKPGFLSQLVLKLSDREILLLDGAEQLSLGGWHWFKCRTRAAGGLIVTTHLPGRLPTLWECRTSAPLLAQLAADLLGTEAEDLQRQAEELFERHRG